MGTRLFVGNLPPRLCLPELEALFAEVGTVQEVDLVTDSITGRSRGFGFVEMASDEEAQAAIAKYHGYELEDQALVVNEAKPRSGERPVRGRDSFTPGMARPQPSSVGGVGGARLYVGNLPYTATSKEIQELFAQVGTVTSVSLITDRMSGQSKGFSFVEMGSAQEAQEAISRFDGHTLQGRPLKVTTARPPERSDGLRARGGGYPRR